VEGKNYVAGSVATSASVKFILSLPKDHSLLLSELYSAREHSFQALFGIRFLRSFDLLLSNFINHENK